MVEVDVSKLAHEQGHVDGAVLWDIYAELKDADYQLARTAAMERLLARSGITPDSTVVFYGYGPAMGFWLMKLYGHADVRILNCSRDAWRAEGRRWSSQQTSPAATSYPLRGQDGQLRAGHTEVAGAIGDPATTIVDVRSEAEYQGSGSGPPAEWSPAAAPVTSRPRSTSPSTGSTTSAGRSSVRPTSAASSPPSISTATRG